MTFRTDGDLDGNLSTTCPPAIRTLASSSLNSFLSRSSATPSTIALRAGEVERSRTGEAPRNETFPCSEHYLLASPNRGGDRQRLPIGPYIMHPEKGCTPLVGENVRSHRAEEALFRIFRTGDLAQKTLA